MIHYSRLEQFLGYFQAIRERSPLTIKEYRYDLVLFFRFILRERKMIDVKTPFKEISISSVDDALLRSIQLTDFYSYLTWLSRERRCGPAARARKTASIRAFLTILRTKRLSYRTIQPLELESPKQLRQLRASITRESLSCSKRQRI